MADRQVLTREECFASLKSRGIAKAEVHFSGGGDEGGVDDIILLNDKNEQIGEMEEYYANTFVMNPITGRSEAVGPPSADEALSEGLSAPVYDRYHSFAGEFHVDGKVIWDVTAQKVTMSGDESHEEFEGFEEEV
jgi:hypothetical protein